MIETVERWHLDNTTPKGSWIFVFGSNLAGRHGAGAAKQAHVSFGAEYKVGKGPTGYAYAIPTKDAHLQPLSLQQIKLAIDEFLEYAFKHPTRRFFVTRICCGLAGFKDEEIAPMFVHAPLNCSFAQEWYLHMVQQKKTA